MAEFINPQRQASHARPFLEARRVDPRTFLGYARGNCMAPRDGRSAGIPAPGAERGGPANGDVCNAPGRGNGRHRKGEYGGERHAIDLFVAPRLTSEKPVPFTGLARLPNEGGAEGSKLGNGSPEPQIDLDASLKKLSAWLARCRASKYDFAEDTKRHKDLASRLKQIAAELEDPYWMWLEEEFNRDPPDVLNGDGTRTARVISNAGRFKGLCFRLRDLAEVAGNLADENPRPRTIPELAIAADCFLHIWYTAGKGRPTLYDRGEAVTQLAAVFSNASYVLSNERVRGILAKAFEEFDRFFPRIGPLMDDLMTWRQ